MNLVEAELADGALHFGGYAISLPEAGSPPADRVIAGIRPEAFEDAAFADPSLPQLDVEVTVLEELGSDAHVIFPVDAPRVNASEVREAVEDEEPEILLADNRAVFNARVDARTAARPG